MTSFCGQIVVSWHVWESSVEACIVQAVYSYCRPVEHWCNTLPCCNRAPAVSAFWWQSTKQRTHVSFIFQIFEIRL